MYAKLYLIENNTKKIQIISSEKKVALIFLGDFSINGAIQIRQSIFLDLTDFVSETHKLLLNEVK